MKLSELSQFISESENKDVTPIKTHIEKEFKRHFPTGWITVSIKKGLSGKQISINFGLIQNISIQRNDPMFHSLLIFIDANDNYTIDPISGTLKVTPPNGSHLAFSMLKTGLRKATGDTKKVERYFTSFMLKLSKLVKKHANDMNGANNDKYDKKFFNVR
jgi:hypothetical protein